MVSARTFAVFAVCIGAAAALRAQSQAARPAAPPQNPRDLSGIWQAIGNNDISMHLLPGEEIVFTKYGAERYRTLDHVNDPSNRCQPTGFLRAMQTAIMPFQIVQTPALTVIAMEYHYNFRLLYTDGRTHPDDIGDYPEWMGHSIGRWEGDVLVVDTVGFNDITWLDTPGLEHSGKLHTIERFQRISPDILKWTVTIEDPVFFAGPFTYAWEFERQDTRIMSYSCTENEKDYAHMRPLIGGLHRNQSALKFPH